MARFLVAAILLTTLAYSSLAFPQTNNEDDAHGSSPLVLLPPESNSGNLKFFFFPFNFWNGFRPLPWIPLPGLLPPTTAAPGGSGDDKEDDKDDEDEEDDKEDEDGEDEEKDEEGDEGNDDEEDGDDE